ncbi:MAG: polysaccharide deacetylase family protein [Rhodobacteraceae bacterium]|nr:polysaccharide deacetylase family protein [Paracoccaceae bacterium]
MTPDWTPFDRELAQWASTGLTLPLWWRDDDATTTGAALDRLTGMAEVHGIRVHLAVIPKTATQGLAAYVSGSNHLIAAVHGWAHRNHAPSGEKKAEFGGHRRVAEMEQEVADGLDKLTGLFGARLSRMFVPPWNRISPQVVTGLQGLGLASLSTFTPRRAPLAAPGLAQINTHLDPVNWRAGRELVDPDSLIAGLVCQLKDRRLGRADNDEPYGILTHHLVHNEAIWGFTDALLSRLMAGPVRVWTALDPA